MDQPQLTLKQILDRYQVTGKWTRARNAVHALFTVGRKGDETEYQNRIATLQGIITAVQEKFMLSGVVPAVLKVCEIEDDPKLQIQFLAAGYELVAGNDFTEKSTEQL